MKERFEGAAGRRRLIVTLKTQKMVAGNSALAEELTSLVEGAEQFGQSELEQCELTRTSSSSDVSLIEVISNPSGKGNSGVVAMLCHLLQQMFAGAYQVAQHFSMVHQKPG